MNLFQILLLVILVIAVAVLWYGLRTGKTPDELKAKVVKEAGELVDKAKDAVGK